MIWKIFTQRIPLRHRLGATAAAQEDAEYVHKHEHAYERSKEPEYWRLKAWTPDEAQLGKDVRARASVRDRKTKKRETEDCAQKH